jgi:diaminopimelate epimerase
MRVEFTKMNGAGNDFLIVDNREGAVSLAAAEIRRICDRRRGVGADGLILIERADDADFRMGFYNSDGGAAEMCGNGARCSAAFAAARGLGRRDGPDVRVRFATDSGPIDATVSGERVAMTLMDARGLRLEVPVRVAGRALKVHFMTVGTRHVVVPVGDAPGMSEADVHGWGREIRHNPAFAPVGANVNFASVDPQGRIHIRTYEKGVEAETHACATGSVACAVLFAHRGTIVVPVTVVQRGGEEFSVAFATRPDGAGEVTLVGPVAVNCQGAIDLGPSRNEKT